MALYSYQAFARDGSQVQGTLDAVSVAAVKEHLLKGGLFPVTINLVQTATQPSWWRSLFAHRITLKDKIFFTKQLSVLLKAGVPILDALELLTEQSEKGLRSLVIELKDGVKQGQSLADGLTKYPKVFDITYVQLVRAGEASGNLEKILDRLADNLERSQELRKKLQKAFRMPIIQLAVVLLVVIALLVVVIPQISETFEGQGMTLPLSTRMLMAMSDLLINNWLILVVSIGTLVGLFLWWKSTASGARAWDNIILKLPVIGYFARMSAVVQFSRTLGMLMEGGVNLPESLTIVCNIVDNRILVDTLNQARENIIKQGKIADYLKQTNLFPAVAIYLINTGEKSGQLDAMLLSVAETYEVEMRDYADSLTSTITSAMPLIIGAVVGFVIAAVVQPITSLRDTVEKSPMSMMK